jgi:hypothetical protein
MSSISHQNSSQDEVVKAVLKVTKMKHPSDIDPLQMKSYTKIFINNQIASYWLLKAESTIYLYNLTMI